ncbi:MAG: class I SAM-dependent methyltransferase [Patescibacteria group bacterium]
MSKQTKHVISDQEAFFNQNAEHKKDINLDSLFSEYANKEQWGGLDWIADKKKILEYGCGTGTSLDVFFKKRKRKEYQIYGVDIAGVAVKKAKENYPEFTFYKISNNKMPQIKDNSLDAAFMFHVLHHTDEHQAIFDEIGKKLKKNGKFLINDLSSNNLINKTARNAFIHMPSFVKKKFGDDLVVGESIPEKYKVTIEEVVKKLKKAGFKVEKVGHGHLFFFVFGWVDRFIPLSKLSLIRAFYKRLIKGEERLLHQKFFQKRTEVFFIHAVKQ